MPKLSTLRLTVQRIEFSGSLLDRPVRLRRRLIAYRQGRTDQNGDFELRGIIPGSYRIYAWSEIWPNEFMNPDFMKKFESRGRPVKIRQYDRLSIDLPVLDAS